MFSESTENIISILMLLGKEALIFLYLMAHHTFQYLLCRREADKLDQHVWNLTQSQHQLTVLLQVSKNSSNSEIGPEDVQHNLKRITTRVQKSKM
jgi:Co/Zn/Cd efflux system component